MKEHVFEAYVTNLGKYNEGDLVGEWVKFPTTTEELQSVLDRIGINEEYEEYFVTEYSSEVVNGLNNHLDEYEQLDNLNYLARRIQEMDQGELEQLNEVMGNNIDVDQEGAIGCINLTYNLDKYNYYPEVTTEEELGIYLVEELETFDVNSMGEFSHYFDYEAYGRDECIKDGGTFVKNGYINKTNTEWAYEYDGNIQNIPDEYRIKTADEQLESAIEKAVDEAMEAAEIPEPDFEMEL